MSGGGYYVGKDGNHPSDYFDGLIDDVRIYNRALNESEIQALYQQSNQTPNTTGNVIFRIMLLKISPTRSYMQNATCRNSLLFFGLLMPINSCEICKRVQRQQQKMRPMQLQPITRF